MAELKNTKGIPIKYLDSDPPNPVEGQMWFNASTSQLKGAVVGGASAGTWASGGDMNQARFLTSGAGSSNSAALAFGGRTPAPADVALTENYNGTAWTEVGDLPAAKSYAAGAGTSTAALSIGGSSPAVPATSGKTESWNGSSWTEITALGRGATSPQSTTYGSGSGSTTSALFYASDEATSRNGRTESWNGSSWTELADQNTARSYAAGVGTSNSSALLAGGLIYPPASANTEIWNGTSWTEVSDLNQARFPYNTSSGQGSATLALIYSGRLYPPNASSALTESWNGTSWTEVADLSTARRAGSGGGTSTSAILGGGSTSGSSPGHVASTEEWNVPDTLTKTVTTS
nr:serine/threonine protein kinase [uncultured Mediterranean phage uvMED]